MRVRGRCRCRCDYYSFSLLPPLRYYNAAHLTPPRPLPRYGAESVHAELSEVAKRFSVPLELGADSLVFKGPAPRVFAAREELEATLKGSRDLLFALSA